VTNPYRAMCAELTDAELANAARKALGEPSYATELHYFLSEDSNEYEPLMLAIRAAIAADRARALLAQPVAEGPTDEEGTLVLKVSSFTSQPITPAPSLPAGATPRRSQPTPYPPPRPND
jgi:hypothetical protein